MANIAPGSTITLYSDIKITNEQQIAFQSKAEQRTYFSKHVLRSKVNCTYVRHNGTLKIEDSVGLMNTCNYISFTNPSFENVVFYARVVDFAYVNNVTVEINYTIDWFQTFMFDVSYEDCLIEREHLSQYDFANAEVNPYDPSIYEFQTNENLEVSKELEPVYEIDVDIDSDSFIAGSIGTEYKRKIVLMAVATFDTGELPDFQEKFLEKCDFVIGTNGFYFGVDGVFASGDEPGGNVPSGNPWIDLLQKIFANTGFVDFATTHGFVIYGFCEKYADLATEGRLKNLGDCLNYLTLQGLTSEILGIYQVDYFYFLSLIKNKEGVDLITTGTLPHGVTARELNVVNKKLMLSPFEYLRVETSDGNIKEYKYEKFNEFIKTSGNKKCEFKAFATFEGTPVLNVIPRNYEYKVPDGWENDEAYRDYAYNKDERVEYSNFPMVPYNIDNYLSFLNQQYTYNLGTRTTGSKEFGMIGSFSDVLNSIGSGVAGLFKSESKGQSAVGLASSGVQGAQSFANAMNRVHGEAETDKMRSIGAEDASQIASGDVVSSVYNVAKSAYIADEYHPGSVGDTLSYILGAETGSVFKITRVHLKDTIISSDDKYFTMYGYNSKRIGIPRICNYINGSTTRAALPQFMSQANGTSATYVKTQNMHVESTMLPVSQFIEQMFNNGIRFVDGTTL